MMNPSLQSIRAWHPAPARAGALGCSGGKAVLLVQANSPLPTLSASGPQTLWRCRAGGVDWTTCVALSRDCAHPRRFLLPRPQYLSQLGEQAQTSLLTPGPWRQDLRGRRNSEVDENRALKLSIPPPQSATLFLRSPCFVHPWSTTERPAQGRAEDSDLDLSRVQ